MIFDIPVHYYYDAKISVISPHDADNIINIDAPTGTVAGVPGIDHDTISDWTLIFDFYAISDYFHFMEGLIWVFIIQHRCFAGRPMQRIIFTNPHWDNAKLLAMLYPGVEIVDLENGREYHVQHLVRLDRMLSKTKINKFLEQALPFGRRFVMQMCDRVRVSAGASVPAGRVRVRPRVLYFKNPPPRCLGALPERSLLALLGGGFEVVVVDLGGLPWEDQVRAVAGSDILVSVHGKGLTNLLWLQPGSIVLDIMPPGFRQYDYQVLCELSGINYFGLEGDLVHRDHGRDGPCRGTAEQGDVIIENLRWPAVNDILAAVRSLSGMVV
jgi:hypothetical protein